MKYLLLLVLFTFTSLNAYAESEVFDRVFVVGLAETQSLDLGQNKYIKNIIIQAEGVRNDVMVDVMAGGVSKGTIYAPGSDPSYIVTIEQEAQFLQFRHLQGGKLRVLSIVVNYSNRYEKPKKVKNKKYKSKVRRIANKAISLIDELRLYTTLDEESEYLMPIKLSAGRLKVMSMAHGDLSSQTRSELINLEGQIELASEFLDVLMQKPILFDYIVELLTLKETIIDILD